MSDAIIITGIVTTGATVIGTAIGVARVMKRNGVCPLHETTVETITKLEDTIVRIEDRINKLPMEIINLLNRRTK